MNTSAVSLLNAQLFHLINKNFIIFNCFINNTLLIIIGTLTVEEVYKDRDQFAALVREGKLIKNNISKFNFILIKIH